MLSYEQKRRYARHILLPELEETGQRHLLDARVLMVGAGGLGASALSYLAAAGIGHIGIMDDDAVELSNLNRQIIHETGDIGRAKVESAADRISELNPDVFVTPYKKRFDESTAYLVEQYDVIIDGTDNFASRFAINTACIEAGKPWVYCAVRGWEAQLSCFINDGTMVDAPCYRCLVPAAPHGRNDCAERGVVGALVGVMGSIIALEVIKLVTKAGTPYHGRLLRYHALSGQWKESRFRRDTGCPDCART